MYLDVRPLGVVHDVRDVVIVCLRLPRLQFAVAQQVLVGQRRDEGFRFCHIHVKGWVAHVRGTVVDEGGLYGVADGQAVTAIDEDVIFPELREVCLFVAAGFIVVRMAIGDAGVGIEQL